MSLQRINLKNFKNCLPIIKNYFINNGYTSIDDKVAICIFSDMMHTNERRVELNLRPLSMENQELIGFFTVNVTGTNGMSTYGKYIYYISSQSIPTHVSGVNIDTWYSTDEAVSNFTLLENGPYIYVDIENQGSTQMQSGTLEELDNFLYESYKFDTYKVELLTSIIEALNEEENNDDPEMDITNITYDELLHKIAQTILECEGKTSGTIKGKDLIKRIRALVK